MFQLHLFPVFSALLFCRVYFSIHIQMNSNHDCDNQAKDVKVQIVQKLDLPTALSSC